MSSKKPDASRQRSTARAEAIANGALEDREEDDDQQQPEVIGTLDSEGRAGPSRTDNPLFNSELVSSIESLARQQEQQQH